VRERYWVVSERYWVGWTSLAVDVHSDWTSSGTCFEDKEQID
jgi:hypothetical protein